MHKNDSPLIPITEDELRPYREEITSFLKNVVWRPDQLRGGKTEIDVSFLLQVGKALQIDESDELSILKNAVRISEDRTILSNSTNVAMNALRDGFCTGRHIAALFEKSSGLESLMQKNKAGNLHQKELPEFHDKLQTQSAVLLFSAASYINFILKEHRTEEADSVQIDFGGIPEVSLTRPSKAMQCSLYYLCAYYERSGIVKNDIQLLKMTRLYFERLQEEIMMRKDSLKDISFFENHHYKLEHSEFVVKGFEKITDARVKGVTFNRISMDDIVANKDAKHLFRRYAERLLCYDFKRSKNPMLELGGLPSITMADGKPGTGKSMLIAATATLLKDRCDDLGFPFLFWPLPENIISTYQGGSAERAIEWFRPMQDTGKIVFAPIDDAENNLEERTRQGVSAGVREFIGVFLRNTEGAYAINNGNRLISLFTNIPDQIDKAVLSRIQIRVSMDGASNFADFVDQDYLWWRKYKKMDKGFVDTNAPKGHEFMKAQKQMSSLNELDSKELEFHSDDLKDIYDTTAKNSDVNSHAFFGKFYENVLARFSFFSSRDLRNIQKAVDARVSDFDFPQDWWEVPDRFFFKDYDTKMNMLKELMTSNLGGLSFEDIRMREALKYIDTAVRINETGINRRINQTAEDLFIRQKAADQLLNRG